MREIWKVGEVKRDKMMGNIWEIEMRENEYRGYFR